MHLLVGHPGDSCCAGVLARLAARGLPAHIVASPLAPPARLAWRLADDGLTSRLDLDDDPAEIAGVLVRGTAWFDPAGWAPVDHAYMQAEMLAATLAWLAGLPCPVVNRPSAALWYRGRASLLDLAPAPPPVRPARPRTAHHQRSRRGPRLPPPPCGRRRRRRGLRAPDRRGRLSRRHRCRLGGPCRPAGAVAGLPQRAARRGAAGLHRRRPSRLGRRPVAREPRARARPAPARRRDSPRLSRSRDRPPPSRPRGGDGGADAGARALRNAHPRPHPRRADRAARAGRSRTRRRCHDPGLRRPRRRRHRAGLRQAAALRLPLPPARPRPLSRRLPRCLALDATPAPPAPSPAPTGSSISTRSRGVYVRFLGPEGRLPPQGDPDAAAALQFEADAGLMALLEDLPCPVVNRIGGGMSNNSKPYQALLLRRAGLKVPTTLVTSDPAAARAFQAEHGEVIYKSASGIRSIVRRLGPDQLARLAFLRDGPAQFQAFVPGRNVRVHTVGDAVFATRIETEAVDYRYAHLDGLDVAMTPVTLPAGGRGRLPARGPRPRPPLRRDRPQGDPGRGIRLLRGQPLPGLHLLRAPHRPADQRGARRPAQRHGRRPPGHEARHATS